MFKLTINNEVLNYDTPVSLLEVANKLKLNDVLAATTNGRIRELTYIVSKDANVKYLSYDSPEAIKVYESTLRFVIAMAIQRLYKKATIKFNYSISRSILGVFELDGKPINQNILNEIEVEIKNIIKNDYQIKRKRLPTGEAIKYYQELGMFNKVEVLRYREEEHVNMYECDGYINYMFGYMLPSTGYIKDFKIIMYHPGFIIQYPRAEFNGEIPKFVDEPNFGRALKDATSWGKTTGGHTIATMNHLASTDHLKIDFINMCETKHNHQLYELGQIIEDNIEDIRLITIAGPSSSGKTTFSNRLRIELKTRAIHPVMISIDDYYLGRDEAPKNEDGSPDLEHIEALDIKRFNEDMQKLINGEEVILPKFNFKLGKREEGRKIKVKKTDPIIIEGIHGLNEELTKSIPKHQKFKIYIAPQTQLSIDNYNPISITDLRLIRRMVRDQKFRNSSAEDTISMWSSVRKGEFRWIYPYQNEANYVFNSELSYEFMVLKKHAVKLLQDVKTESPYFITANRLHKFLKYFVDIEDEMVANSSLLREFIGDSIFEH